MNPLFGIIIFTGVLQFPHIWKPKKQKFKNWSLWQSDCERNRRAETAGPGLHVTLKVTRHETPPTTSMRQRSPHRRTFNYQSSELHLSLWLNATAFDKARPVELSWFLCIVSFSLFFFVLYFQRKDNKVRIWGFSFCIFNFYNWIYIKLTRSFLQLIRNHSVPLSFNFFH